METSKYQKPTSAALFARRMAIAMGVRGIKARELAVATGLSEGHISRLLSGERIPSLSTLDKLADALWTTSGELWRVGE